MPKKDIMKNKIIKKSTRKNVKQYFSTFRINLLKRDKESLKTSLRNRDWRIENLLNRIETLEADNKGMLHQLSLCMAGHHCADCVLEPTPYGHVQQTIMKPERACMEIQFHPAEYYQNPSIIKWQSEVIANQFRELMEKLVKDINYSYRPTLRYSESVGLHKSPWKKVSGWTPDEVIQR
jgi:hypothetical protein